MEKLIWWLRPMCLSFTKQNFAKSSVQMATALTDQDASSSTTYLKPKIHKFSRPRKSREHTLMSKMLPQLSKTSIQFLNQVSLLKCQLCQLKLRTQTQLQSNSFQLKFQRPLIKRKMTSHYLLPRLNHLCQIWSSHQQPLMSPPLQRIRSLRNKLRQKRHWTQRLLPSCQSKRSQLKLPRNAASQIPARCTQQLKHLAQSAVLVTSKQQLL